MREPGDARLLEQRLAVQPDHAAGQRGRAGDRNLLAQVDPDRQLKRIPASRNPDARTLVRQRTD
jgi:hypothetical protein